MEQENNIHWFKVEKTHSVIEPIFCKVHLISHNPKAKKCIIQANK